MDQVNGKPKESEMCIRQVPVEWLDRTLPLVHHYIRDSTDYHPVMEFQDIVELLYRRMLTLVVGIVDDELVGIALLQVEQYPRERACNIMGLAAKNGIRSRFWQDTMDYIEDWAAQRGCARVFAEGRRGWMKVAKKMGFHAEQRTVLSKEIRDVRRRQLDSEQRPVEWSPRTASPELRERGIRHPEPT